MRTVKIQARCERPGQNGVPNVTRDRFNVPKPFECKSTHTQNTPRVPSKLKRCGRTHSRFAPQLRGMAGGAQTRTLTQTHHPSATLSTVIRPRLWTYMAISYCQQPSASPAQMIEAAALALAAPSPTLPQPAPMATAVYAPPIERVRRRSDGQPHATGSTSVVSDVVFAGFDRAAAEATPRRRPELQPTRHSAKSTLPSPVGSHARQPIFGARLRLSQRAEAFVQRSRPCAHHSCRGQ